MEASDCSLPTLLTVSIATQRRIITLQKQMTICATCLLWTSNVQLDYILSQSFVTATRSYILGKLIMADTGEIQAGSSLLSSEILVPRVKIFGIGHTKRLSPLQPNGYVVYLRV